MQISELELEEVTNLDLSPDWVIRVLGGDYESCGTYIGAMDCSLVSGHIEEEVSRASRGPGDSH